MTDFPAELERWTLSNALQEAQGRIDVETSALLEKRLKTLGLPNYVYQPFNFKSEDINLTSPRLRGLYTDEIKKIRDRTQCPELQRYLLLLTTRPEKTWAWTEI